MALSADANARNASSVVDNQSTFLGGDTVAVDFRPALANRGYRRTMPECHGVASRGSVDTHLLEVVGPAIAPLAAQVSIK